MQTLLARDDGDQRCGDRAQRRASAHPDSVRRSHRSVVRAVAESFRAPSRVIVRAAPAAAQRSATAQRWRAFCHQVRRHGARSHRGEARGSQAGRSLAPHRKDPRAQCGPRQHAARPRGLPRLSRHPLMDAGGNKRQPSSNWVHPCHICTRTARSLVTSAPGLGGWKRRSANAEPPLLASASCAADPGTGAQ